MSRRDSLDPGARALIDAGKRGEGTLSSDARARVRQSVLRRAALPGAAAALAATTATTTVKAGGVAAFFASPLVIGSGSVLALAGAAVVAIKLATAPAPTPVAVRAAHAPTAITAARAAPDVPSARPARPAWPVSPVSPASVGVGGPATLAAPDAAPIGATSPVSPAALGAGSPPVGATPSQPSAASAAAVAPSRPARAARASTEPRDVTARDLAGRDERPTPERTALLSAAANTPPPDVGAPVLSLPQAANAPAPAIASASPGAAPTAGAPAPPAPALVEQLALLHTIHAELQDRHASAALAELDAHAALLDASPFAEEAAAARVTALTQLGRTADARAALDRFVARWPASPLAARLAPDLR